VGNIESFKNEIRAALIKVAGLDID